MKNISPTLKNGFSLVEIMIVTAIIAIVASMAVPNLLRAQRSAQQTDMIKDIRVLFDVMEMYHANTGRYPTNLNSLLITNPPYLPQRVITKYGLNATLADRQQIYMYGNCFDLSIAFPPDSNPSLYAFHLYKDEEYPCDGSMSFLKAIATPGLFLVMRD